MAPDYIPKIFFKSIRKTITMTFQRSIGSLALLFAAIGSIIGSGWLFGPLYAAQIAGPAAILSWIIGGVLMLIVSFTFAELSAAFPVAGGMVHFAELSHGSLMSFTVGWMVWLSSMIVAPVETLAILQYAGTYVPGLVRKINDAHTLTPLGMGAAAIVMFVMNIFNWWGAKFFSRASTVVTGIKIVVPILVVVALFALDFHSSNLHMAGGFAPYGWHGIFAALSLGGVVYSFIGYGTAIQMAAETKNPKRAIPLAIIGSTLFCIVLYSLLQIVFVGAMKPEYLIHGWQHLSFSGDQGPFAGILMTLGIVWLMVIIYGDAIFSPFGTGFFYAVSTARVNYAMSEISFFPEFFKKLSLRGVPMRAVVFNYIVGLLLFLPFPGWQSMASFIVSCFVISYAIGPLALMPLRKFPARQPGGFRLPYGMWFAIIGFYICNLLVFWAGWDTVYRLMIAMVIGVLVLLYRDLRAHKKILSWRTGQWLLPYFVGLGVISYLGTFGNGINVLKFGVDFFVIAIFSIIIYALAMHASRTTQQANS
jgi:amino acid transporter